MAVNYWVKVVGILIGGTVAAAAAAYVGGVFERSPGSPPMEAAVQQAPAGQTGMAKESPAGEEAKADVPATAEDKAKQGEQMASLTPADQQPDAMAPADQTGPAPDIIVPAFDLVRVEPNGSVVIAGNAAPGSTVELIAGATVIGSAKAGESGDFAVVLDEPLKPGDYTVVLRATGADSVVTTSAQTAIIAVPETDNGQVLALVEEPGAPSRLITVPTAPESAKEVEMAAKGDRPAATEKAAEETAAATDEKPATETQAAAEAPAATEEPAAETAMAADKPVSEEAAPAEETQMAAVEQPKEETAAPAAPAAPAAAPRIAVEAVEIEGRQVFVAGHAEAGTTVRVYANDILLGQTVASDGGRFLIEAEKDLPVGDYIVRADMLSSDNADVVARAAVPFEREPGEKIAAVATPEPAQTETKSADTMMAEKDASGASKEEDTALKGDMAAKDDGGQTAKSETTEVAALDKGESKTMTDAKAGESTMQASAEPAGNDDTDPVEATAPKLQNVGGAVIIRRGDTLWRLSRRVYGRGVRYTTIYLANQEQIADPDMIWPGQVFSVPSETDEGEEADMSAVAEQMADPNAESEEVVTR